MDELFTNTETESCSSCIDVIMLCKFPKIYEQLVQIFLWDTHTIVLDPDLKLYELFLELTRLQIALRLILYYYDLDCYQTIIRSELKRIWKKVNNDLLISSLITIDLPASPWVLISN